MCRDQSVVENRWDSSDTTRPRHPNVSRKDVLTFTTRNTKTLQRNNHFKGWTKKKIYYVDENSFTLQGH